MANIIQVTTFSGQDGAKQLAELKVRRCDSVIYCKTNAEANCYRAIIAHYAGGRKGVDHLYGTIAICVDPSSTAIEGLHLISQRIPSHIKSTYPFQFQAKKVGEDVLERFLTSCGLTTEKELKAVWERCAKRLAFPIEATSDEKSNYFDMFDSADSIMQNESMAKRQVFIDEINQADADIMKWLNSKYAQKFRRADSYRSWRKSWRVERNVDNETYTFNIDMDFSQSAGVETFRVNCSGVNLTFSFPWSQDKNMAAVINRIEMIWDQFIVIIKAISNARKATTMNSTVA